tara:strand:- start:60 stop:254 length:195 start_codon:yes stop_codon:yes gene_type:complete
MAKKETEGYITLGKNLYKISWLKSVNQDKAIQILTHPKQDKPRNQIVNAWKQANGLSVRNYSKK